MPLPRAFSWLLVLPSPLFLLQVRCPCHQLPAEGSASTPPLSAPIWSFCSTQCEHDLNRLVPVSCKFKVQILNMTSVFKTQHEPAFPASLANPICALLPPPSPCDPSPCNCCALHKRTAHHYPNARLAFPLRTFAHIVFSA